MSFQSWLDTPSKRTAAMREICERWRDTKLFDDVCGPKKWRAKLYPIYADPFGALDHPDHDEGTKQLNFVFEMERSACSLFGVVTYGVHMSIYQEVLGLDGERSLAVWVPTRARTKPTYVQYLCISLFCYNASRLDSLGSLTTRLLVAFPVGCLSLSPS